MTGPRPGDDMRGHDARARPSSPWRRRGGWAAIVAGSLMLAMGLVYAGSYVLGVIDVLDEPDRSWIFWGIAILVIGLGLASAGVAVIAWGRTAIRPGSAR